MKKGYFFLWFIGVQFKVYGQDYVSPLSVNHLLVNRTHKMELKPRGGDTTNILANYTTGTIPFYDDFSKDRMVPRDLTPYITNRYFVSGICTEYKNYKRGRYKFSTKPTFLYIYDPSNPPLFVDSVSNPLTMTSIGVYNDTPNCVIANLDNFYPSTFRRYYSATGVEVFSQEIFDTILYVAQIQEATLKRFLWTDRHAYVNNHLPYMPYSKGVATLDGLNEYGRPYDTVVTNAYGRADYLTTIPIDLSALSFNDSVYLSFMYEPQGYGDWPDKQDSLVVEFKDDQNQWHQVFRIVGLSRAQALDTMKFRHALVQIPQRIVPSDPMYFHPNFQLRFKNYATISGNNDHWHIDYVRLDSGRNFIDTIIKDATFVYELPTVLKNYTLLPAKQYRGHIDLLDTVIGWNRNILPAPIFSVYKYDCINENTGQVYGSNTVGIPYRAEWLVPIYLQPKTELNYPQTIADSTYITSRIFLDPSDITINNDTATNRQFFFNEMSYDDGTAEMAYGIQGLGIKKVAYRFVIPNKDTLAAIKVLFSNIDVPVFNLVFNFQVWKTIGMNGKTEKIIKSLSNSKPVYKDSLNSFVIFGLDTPIEVQDTIYIGWIQTDERNLQIGYDRNDTNGINNTFIMTNNVWSKTNIIEKGSPMMRLILDGKRNYRSYQNAAVKPIKDVSIAISLYPNPASSIIKIESTDDKPKECVIFDLLGKQIYHGEFRNEMMVDVNSWMSGFYIAHILLEGEIIQKNKIQIER